MSAAIPLPRLQDVAELNPSLDAVLADDDMVSFLPMSAVNAENVDAVDTETRRFKEVSGRYTPFMVDDVLVAKITPCFENGKIAQAKPTRGIGFGSTEFHVIRPHRSKLDARYLVHFLRQERIRKEGERKMTGSAGQRRVPEHFLANLPIPLPPLPEQRRIAEILDKADALRAKRRAALAQLDTLTQSIFLDMFGDPFTRRGDSVPLGKVAEILMGQSPPGASYNVVGDGTPLLNGPTEFGSRYPVEKQWTTEPTRLCAKGDILFCVRGATAGRLNRADKVYCLGRGLAAIRPRAGAPVSAEFLFAVLARYYDYFQAKGVGSTFINISRQELESIPIPRSTHAQAEALTRQIAAAEKAKEVHVRSQVGLEALFSSLQYRAFTGGL